MKEIVILNKNNQKTLKANLFTGKNNHKICVLVGGSGDTRNTFNQLVVNLQPQLKSFDFLTFSFKGTEENIQPSLYQQTLDLKNVINYLPTNYLYNSINLICTSMGAYSTTKIITDQQYDKLISNVIYIDPADYYIRNEKNNYGLATWVGYQEYLPKNKTISSLLKNLKSSVKIYVIHLLLRNYGPKGYAPVAVRGIDNASLYPRLNTNMVRSFFDNCPAINKGAYIEDRQLPHAFVRDGNLQKNIKNISELIQKCFK